MKWFISFNVSFRKSSATLTKPLQVDENEEDKPPNELNLVNHTNGDVDHTPVGYRFSLGQLPQWAKKQVRFILNIRYINLV